MSLDLLKQRFNGKLITSQYEDEIENKEKIIEKLEEETNNLSNQVLNLESEKNNLIQELNKARHFEEGTFSIKEKDYINELQSKENVIKEIKSEFNPLYETIDKQKDRLSHKDNLLKKHIKIIKELNKKINKLNYRLNYEKKNSKEVISEIKSERKKTYQEYINNLDIYENTITSKNDIIDNYKTKLKESLNKLKEASNLIINLKKDIKINENVRQELKEKKEEITNLNGQVYSLSKEVTQLSNLSQENSILEAKLEKAQSFQDIVVDKKEQFDKFLKETNNLSTFKLVNILTDISRKKQGNDKLTWNKWLEIPESNYLFHLDENIAKKIFNESQVAVDKARISMKANLNEARRYSVGRGDAPDTTLLPTTIQNVLFYGNNSSLILSSSVNEDWGAQDEVTQITDLSGRGNHVVQHQISHSGDTSGLIHGTSRIGNPHIDTGSYGIRFGYRPPQSGANSKADRMSFTNTMNLDAFTAFYVIQAQSNAGDDPDQTRLFLGQLISGSGVTTDKIEFKGNYQSDSGSVVIVQGRTSNSNSDIATINASSDVAYNVKFLLTITKASYADGGLVTAFINKTNVGTNDDFTKDIDVKINMIGDDSFTNDAFDLFEMAYYDRVLTDKERINLQDYFIDRQSIVDNFI